MSPKKRSGGSGKSHQFGGNWTTAKLDVVAEYLARYTTALKNTPFRKGYIDAFAGTGYRDARRESETALSSQLLFPDLAKQEPQDLLEGSAVRALKTNPHFDSYIFIERSPARCKQLEKLKSQFPNRASAIEIRQGEANLEIQALCSRNWSSHRAVLLLDPYGMQVEWKTIEAIALTKAVDLWLLFPLGIGVNRLLTRSGDIPEFWRKRLDRCSVQRTGMMSFTVLRASRRFLENQRTESSRRRWTPSDDTSSGVSRPFLPELQTSRRFC